MMNKNILSILSISLVLTGCNFVFATSARAGCNTFGCSNSSIAECNPFGCPNPNGEACTPFGCPPGREPVSTTSENTNNSNNDGDNVNNSGQTDFQFCVEKLEKKGYSTSSALRECRAILQ